MARNDAKFQRYVFHAKAVAAHFQFTDGRPDFGAEYALAFHAGSPFKHHAKTGRRTDSEISFTHSWVHVSCKEERGGVYTTIVRSGVKNYSVQGKVTADELEAGIMTVYRKEWYSDSSRPKRARILPLPPVIKDLKICGRPYRLGKELQLPEPFGFNDARRKKYFRGDEPEIEPVGVSAAPGRSESTECGEIEISADTRRIAIPNFGIVTLADWTWVSSKIHLAAHTAQWIQLVGLDLKNPGRGGGAGVGGNGTSGT